MQNSEALKPDAITRSIAHARSLSNRRDGDSDRAIQRTESSHMKVPSLAAASAAGTRVLSIQAVAQQLDVSTKTVRRWVDRGELPHHRLGRAIKITQPDLSVFMAMRRRVGKESH